MRVENTTPAPAECGENRSRWSLLKALVVILIFAQILSYTSISYFFGPMTSLLVRTKYRDVAIVYAVPSFHDEVAASVACVLDRMGYDVVMYVGWNQFSTANFLSFSNGRISWSGSLYGHCVTEWRSVRIGLFGDSNPSDVQMAPELLQNVRLITFISFPFSPKDYAAFSLIKQIQTVHDGFKAEKSDESSRNLPQVGVIHHKVQDAYHFAEYSSQVEEFLPREVIVHLYLGEHTFLSAFYSPMYTDVPTSNGTSHSDANQRTDKIRLSQRKTANGNISHFQVLGDHYRMAYFYPVLPLVNLLDYKSVDSAAVFSIQGSVGSATSLARKDVGSQIMCIEALTQEIQATLSEPLVVANSTTLRKVGGVANQNHSRQFRVRANVDEIKLFAKFNLESKCKAKEYEPEFSRSVGTREISKEILMTSVRGNKDSELAELLYPTLDIIGNNPRSVLDHIDSSDVQLKTKLPPPEFYRAISRTKFLLPALGDDQYCRNRATSSIPAAVMTRVPIVTSRNFLDLYPLLRDMPVHRKISKADECASMLAAIALTPDEYEAAKQELATVGAQWFEEAQQSFARILSPP